jgi:hypothetical protein
VLRGTPVIVIAAALLVAGCGGDDGGVSVANGGDGLSAAADQETADEAIAAVEQSLRDDGFSPSADETDPAFESEECREFDEALSAEDQALPGETARAESGPFERAEGGPSAGVLEGIGVEVVLVEEPDDLDPVLELFDQHLGQCIPEAFRLQVERAAAENQVAAEVGDIAVEELGSEGLGDAGGGVQLTGDVTASEATVPFSYAVQFVRVDRAIVLIDIRAIGPNEPTADRVALLRILIDALGHPS